ncbi:hypothetical protein V6N13_082312 [Hibiscus sabdariffa]
MHSTSEANQNMRDFDVGGVASMEFGQMKSWTNRMSKCTSTSNKDFKQLHQQQQELLQQTIQELLAAQLAAARRGHNIGDETSSLLSGRQREEIKPNTS